MKKIVFLLLIAANTLSAQYFNWAKQFAGLNYDRGYDIYVDKSGNSYTIGAFEGTVDFDPGPGMFQISPVGYSDIFITKLDKNGNFLWAKSMGGSDFDEGLSVTADRTGNIYITGRFKDTADFDPGPASFLMTAVWEDIFICKLDSNGNFIWAKEISNGLARGITTDDSCNIYIAGQFGTTADFDPGPGVYNMSASSDDGFVAKLDSAGNFKWAKQFAGTGNCNCYAIAVDGFRNVCVCGLFIDSTDFDTGAAVYTFTSTQQDAFVCKLNNDGAFLWASAVGSQNLDIACSLAADSAGNVYYSGLFSGPADFDPGPGMYTLNIAGQRDAFCSKLDNNGNFDWAFKIGSIYNDESYAISLDDSANIYFTLSLGGSADINPNAGSIMYTPVSNYPDLIIEKIDSSGIFHWAVVIQGAGLETCNGIDLDKNRNIYFTGYFSNSADFDTGPQSNTLTAWPSGVYDIFVCKLNTCTPVFITQSTSACYSFTSPSGQYVWTATGTYQDTIVNPNGCDSIFTINLTINTVNLSVSQNGNTLTSNASSAQYQWLDCNNGFAAVSGATDQSFSPSASGNFAVAVNINGCADTSSCYFVNVQTCTFPSNVVASFTSCTNNCSGTANISFTGCNNGPYTVEWYNGGAFIQTETFSTSPYIADSICCNSQPYTVYVYDSAGSAIATINVSATCPSPPLVVKSVTHPSCNDTCDGEIRLNIAGTHQPFTINYNPPQPGFPSVNDTLDNACAGNYTITVTNSIGCTTTIYATLTGIDTSVTASADTLSSNNATATYQWLDCNSGFSIIPGETNQSFIPSYNGNFAVEVSQNGCVDTSSCYFITTLGVSEKYRDRISVYPNPAKEVIYIRGLEPHSTIRVLDCSGRLLIQQTTAVTEASLDAASIENGIYFIEVVTDNKKFISKVIISH